VLASEVEVVASQISMIRPSCELAGTKLLNPVRENIAELWHRMAEAAVKHHRRRQAFAHSTTEFESPSLV